MGGKSKCLTMYIILEEEVPSKKVPISNPVLFQLFTRVK